MSKKMWRKIFKSKPQKQQQQQLNKINKRHSRGIYEEYQQLNELLSGEQHKSQSLCSENEHEIENGKNGNINVFEQQPQQSSFNSAALLSEAQQEQQQLQQQQQQQQQQQSQQLSTFSRVRNTFSLRRSSNNNNNNSNNSNNGNKKQTPNPKSTTMESDPVDNDQIHEVNELESPGPITTGASIPVPEHAAVGDLSECPCCKRTFNPNALRKHVAFCGKKRKVFDSSRQRREGTALSTYVLPKNFGLPNAEKAAGLHTPPGVSRESSSIASGGSQQLPPTDAAASPASTRRKTNTDQARATARSSLKKAAGAAAESSGAAAAPSGLTRDRMRSSDRSISKRIKDTASERCPHCERSFNPKAFDRHVEWCKEKAIQANIKAANTVETNKAKERMEARKQYRPPNLKTKRSLNRDKYSGSIEEQQQYEAEMVAQKQTLMSLSAMTSSVQSDNSQRTEKPMKAPRPGTPQQRQAPVKPKSTTTQITQNTVSLCVASAEEANTFKPRRKQRETCQEIDVAVDRLRRKATADTLQLAKLDCIEAAPLLPAKSRRRTTRPKLVEAAEKLIAPDQAICTFEDLNGLLLRKAGSKICNIKMNMNEQELNVGNKTRSTTSLVRQAHRRPRTRASPVLDLQSLEAPKAISSFDLTGIEKSSTGASESSQAGSDNESSSLCGEIQLKMEMCTIRTVRPPKKREHLPTIMNSCEPLRALPMAERKESVKDVPLTQLPLIESKDVPRDHYKEDRFLDAENGMLSAYDDCEYDDVDIEVGQFMDKAKPLTDDESEPLDELETDNEREQRDAKKLSPFRQRSNVSRRLVLLEQDEEAVIYIKATSQSSSPTSRRARSSPGSECPLLNRSDSNASSKTSQSSNRSYKSMNSFDENTQKSLDDSQKREIFISIETEANAQGHSPISPQSLRHMVGNAQTPIDVLHIENGNEPEHAKFSKISDTEEDHLDAEIEDDARHVHYSKRSVLSSIPAPTLPLPNVRANNAKNEIEKRLGEFKQIGEEFGDSVRRNVLQHQEHVQQVLKCNSHLSPSPSGDSDELSSLDGYPMSSSQSSRRGASSKLSSDSAYGSSSNSPISLSQRSGDKQLHISNAQRTQKQLRPHTAGGALASSSGKPASRSNKSDASTQAQTNYGTLKERQQLYAGIGPSDGQAGYSSSCSEISLPVAQPQQQQQQNSNFNYHQQQQHQHQHQQQSQVETAYNNNNNNNNNNYEHNAQNNMNNNTINAASTALASSQHSLSSNTSNGSSSMTASMKMSNYCYECGSKFMIGHAKFCVECGVKRVAL
ncbi:uncharacterized protein LOC133845882 isoform X6 [Drosophila sulfurigaster albostrigata]|uniref:uncharacterized protein LOC133845882 isoform X6 n=1 Tax=Drosophila sulfurigaster albostrigata TaxID=89887 RepID=UPI002D21D60C|nr:uncharacterized protein LOC133845882 isoform X6 [Drosophila sulfurigaster albostrigata]